MKSKTKCPSMVWGVSSTKLVNRSENHSDYVQMIVSQSSPMLCLFMYETFPQKGEDESKYSVRITGMNDIR